MDSPKNILYGLMYYFHRNDAIVCTICSNLPLTWYTNTIHYTGCYLFHLMQHSGAVGHETVLCMRASLEDCILVARFVHAVAASGDMLIVCKRTGGTCYRACINVACSIYINKTKYKSSLTFAI